VNRVVLEEKVEKKPKNRNRPKDTYRRELPEQSEVTETHKHEIWYCPIHKIPLKKFKKRTIYTEDIELP